jgi:hypothetical protein
MIHQSLSEFVSSPLQGAIPQPTKPISQAQAQSIIDDLQTALQLLQSAHEAAKEINLKAFDGDAYSDICDALHYCSSASDYLAEIGSIDDA